MSKPFVFVLMPFDETFADIYKFGIKEAANDAGGYCERVDEQYYEERILDRIYNQINKADVIVADLTGRNPNVFYETGYAHALDKRVILLTSNADDIPFDLKHHFHIVYNGSISTLKEQLTRRLKWYFENPNKDTLSSIGQIELYFNEQKITEGSNTTVDCRLERSRGQTIGCSFSVNMDICNISSYIFGIDTKFGIELTTSYQMFEYFTSQKKFGQYRSKENKNVFISLEYFELLLPSCWETSKFTLYISTSDDLTEQAIATSFKLYTPNGTETVNFNLLLNPTNK